MALARAQARRSSASQRASRRITGVGDRLPGPPGHERTLDSLRRTLGASDPSSHFVSRIAAIPSSTVPYIEKVCEVTSRRVGRGHLARAVRHRPAGAAGVRVIGGLDQSMPCIILPQFACALFGRYDFKRRLGTMRAQPVIVLCASYQAGAGLIARLGLGVVFMSEASFRARPDCE